jgi:hypothetical protein
VTREWKPGDVALWIDSTGVTHRLFREGYGERGDGKARWFGATCGEAWPEPFDDLRPLVVIDSEDREQVERLTRLIFEVAHPFPGRVDATAAALREFADPKPPTPRCVAHGNEACPDCSRITGQHLAADGECSGCGSYGDTGMHWDTCPGRVKGTLYATRDEAMRP